MVTLPRTGSRPRRLFGGNFAGEDGPGRGAGPHASRRPQRGAQPGVIPERGRPALPARGAGPGRTGRGTHARSDRRSGDPGADGFGARSGRRLRGGGAATPPRRFQRLQPHRTLPAPPPPQVRPPRPGLGWRPLRTRTLRSPGAASPPPRPALSPTHLASTGTWAIPGLGPR